MSRSVHPVSSQSSTGASVASQILSQDPTNLDAWRSAAESSSDPAFRLRAADRAVTLARSDFAAIGSLRPASTSEAGRKLINALVMRADASIKVGNFVSGVADLSEVASDLDAGVDQAHARSRMLIAYLEHASKDGAAIVSLLKREPSPELLWDIALVAVHHETTSADSHLAKAVEANPHVAAELMSAAGGDASGPDHDGRSLARAYAAATGEGWSRLGVVSKIEARLSETAVPRV